jgi:uncharacterized protein YyaL (SSP411 family)
MPNRLAKETSPYLQQHADNPVDWYPWGGEALAEAKRTGKPILLSVGYSACHWCHVMAHESFEDADIARVMNENFVNIKVDREERPDIDQIYQVAQAMLTQRNGGWPLTMFLTPEQLPFFGGTYFPNRPKYGMPGFGDLLKRVRAFYDENPHDIRAHGEQLVQALARTSPRAAGSAEFNPQPLDLAAQYLAQAFDSVEGGFSGAPKFPHPDTIELLMRRHAALGDRAALERATLTLRKMAEGGIYDQVGGGFARYSVDEMWAIPHFEKMLYDNGWLLRLYADAWSITRDPLFKRVVEETVAWVMREMQSPEGGYYSSLDADSEGEEGKFYVWTPDEVRALLTPEEVAVVSRTYGLEQPPNFENHAWHFVIANPVDEASRPTLDSARAKLRAAREKRVRPGRDEKILASWNALMIGGMAHASRVFGKPEWLASARSALEFDAYLDDHAYLLAALIEVTQAEFDSRDLAWATEIGHVLLDEFFDSSEGGFFFTSHDHETLIHRPKPGPDNATPSGNGVAASALLRLGFLTGEPRFGEAAEKTLALFWPQIERQPASFGTMLAALEELLSPTRTLIITGPRAGFAPWRELLDSSYLPAAVVLFLDSTSGIPEVLAKPVASEVNAYICEGVTCLAPVQSLDQLREKLQVPTIAAFPPATHHRSPS